MVRVWTSRRPILYIGLAVALALCLIPIARSSGPQESDKASKSRGGELYQMYCSNCHGKRGLGHGPMAQILTVAPPNLTHLAKQNRGEFPTERVSRSIDGREEVRGHGQRHMPIWGLAFQEYDRDTNQEAEVRFRVRELVAYLESIQE